MKKPSEIIQITDAELHDFAKGFGKIVHALRYKSLRGKTDAQIDKVINNTANPNHPGNILDRTLLTCVNGMVEELGYAMANGAADEFELSCRYQEQLYEMLRDHCAKQAEVLAKGRDEHDTEEELRMDALGIYTGLGGFIPPRSRRRKKPDLQISG